MPLFLTYLLNLFDLAMTYYWYNLCGLSIEGNPLGRWLLETNLAIPFKTLGVGVALFALYVGIKRHPRWRWASWLVLGVYGVLAVYHVWILVIIGLCLYCIQ